MPIGHGRKRGRTLSDADRTRVRDYILTLLHDACELSVPDVQDVIGRLALSRRQIYDRLSKCPRMPTREIMVKLLESTESPDGA